LRRRLPEAVLGVLWILPALVLIAGLILYPVAYAIWLSLFDKHSFFPAERWVGLGNYARIAGDAEFWDSLWKGVVYAGASTVLQLVLGLPRRSCSTRPSAGGPRSARSSCSRT